MTPVGALPEIVDLLSDYNTSPAKGFFWLYAVFVWKLTRQKTRAAAKQCVSPPLAPPPRAGKSLLPDGLAGWMQKQNPTLSP